MKRTLTTTLIGTLGIGLFGTGLANAEPYRVVVSIENLAPQNGTFQTPHWVGFHDGLFDIYDGNTPADNDPIPSDPRRSVERLAEDGNTGPITETFAEIQPEGIDGTIPGLDGALAPGEVTSQSFVLDAHNPFHRYFSYASMVLPSNDIWYANGNPLQHPVFDDKGNFIAEDFFVINDNLLDAGTEINDEIPANTAFFGQTTPDTGVDENGVILDFRDDNGNPRFSFQAKGSGGILDDSRFAMADFSKPGYPVVKISFKAYPAIMNEEKYVSRLSGDSEVPPVHTDAYGLGRYDLTDEGAELRFVHLIKLAAKDILAVHLHRGAKHENGPIVATLVGDENRDERLRTSSRLSNPGHITVAKGSVTTAELEGPLKGQPLDALVHAIQEGNVYVNVHTESYPDGEIRGQLYIADQ